MISTVRVTFKKLNCSQGSRSQHETIGSWVRAVSTVTGVPPDFKCQLDHMLNPGKI